MDCKSGDLCFKEVLTGLLRRGCKSLVLPLEDRAIERTILAHRRIPSFGSGRWPEVMSEAVASE